MQHHGSSDRGRKLYDYGGLYSHSGRRAHRYIDRGQHDNRQFVAGRYLNGTALPTTATLTPTSADFGSVYAGGGLSTAKSFTFTNTSAIAINFTSATVSGNFTSTTNCPASLAAEPPARLPWCFAPLTSGALTGTLTVVNSTSANPTLTASLAGTGIPTTASLSPVTGSYANTIVGQTSSPDVFHLDEYKRHPLTISKVSTTGDFSVSSTNCSGSIAAGSFCQVYVTFVPTVLGARTGTVTVASTASANPSLTATLTGRGVADVEANVSSLNFGNVDLGIVGHTAGADHHELHCGCHQLYRVRHYGRLRLHDHLQFGHQRSGNCTVTVNFTPTALGTRSGTFTINTNDTKYPVIDVSLTGNGVDFAISIAPTSGSTLAGYTVDVTATLTPLGGFSAPVTLGCATNAGGSTCAPAVMSPILSAAVATPSTSRRLLNTR